MFLHEDRDAFEYLLMNVSAATGIDDGILEKDYYVTVKPDTRRTWRISWHKAVKSQRQS